MKKVETNSCALREPEVSSRFIFFASFTPFAL